MDEVTNLSPFPGEATKYTVYYKLKIAYTQCIEIVDEKNSDC